MSTCRSLVLLFGVASLAMPRNADACGPFFPPELFFDRAATLANLPDGTFMVEAKKLVPKPDDGFGVVEGAVEDEPAHAREGGGVDESALYQAGAAAWKAAKFDQAGRKFEQVLDLLPAARKHFSTFAAFMLGRNGAPEESLRRFAQVRDLASAGFADPLGLAVASFGEEARVHLRAGNDREAIRLYAEQAAHGSDSGAQSLLFVARALAAKPERLEKVLSDPLAQRLLTLYAWTRGNESWYDGNEERRPPTAKLLDALAALPALDGADQLAAAAWRMGRFDLAERFAPKSQTPLALWVASKLALRRGDKGAGEQLLAKVVAGYMADPGFHPRSAVEGDGLLMLCPRDFAARALGDAAVLALARGDFVGALDKAVANGSFADAAYLAERVLTKEELERFLAQKPAVEGDHMSRLRALLARRWLRAGQLPRPPAAFAEPALFDLAKQYVGALEAGRTSRDPIDRARSLFTAAQIARKKGMELLGTEVAPDWAVERGEYDLGAYDGARAFRMDGKRQWDEPDLTAPHPLAKLRNSLMSADEQARVARNQPTHAQRFHYREAAADLAEDAAHLVPRRSQAYFALLCTAARYVANTNPDRMQRLWTDYVHNGAVISEGPWTFGQGCPEPQFDKARQMAAAARAWHWPHLRKRTIAAFTVACLGLGALAALVIRRTRRAR